MGNNRIDRLFEEKLARQELEPTNEAWAQVQAGLNKENKPVIWWRVAAAVAVLGVSAALVLSNQKKLDSPMFSADPTDHPQPLAEVEWDFPIPVKVEKVVEEVTPASKKIQRPTAFAKVEVMELEEVKGAEEINILPELEPVQPNEAYANLITNEESLMEAQIESLPQLQVQITYKAGDQVEPKQDKSKIGQLWAKAIRIKPGDVLADLRETKNDFFNGKKN